MKVLVNEGGADVEVRDPQGRTALYLAAEQGHLNVVRYLVEQGSADINCTTKIGWTPLHAACAAGHIEVARFLVEEGQADILGTMGSQRGRIKAGRRGGRGVS